MNSASLVTIDILFTYFATKAGSALKICSNMGLILGFHLKFQWPETNL